MKNFLVKMAYNGAAYHGFQRQNNATAIQQVVEEAIESLTGQQVSINGCSRTDAGVHAREYYFNFKIDSGINCRGLIFGLNDRLPDDIAILDCREASQDFHARFCCKGKEYRYLVHNSEIKDPFYKDTVYRSWFPIDAEKLDRAAKDFVGEHDFKAFCSADCDKENTVRTIYRFDVKRSGDIVEFIVAGSGFLYNMVRIMVGTLLYINEGKIGEKDIPALLKAKDRTKAGLTVPPQGLYLNKVFYDDKGFD